MSKPETPEELKADNERLRMEMKRVIAERETLRKAMSEVRLAIQDRGDQDDWTDEHQDLFDKITQALDWRYEEPK